MNAKAPLAAKIYRGLLRALPRDFRESYGAEMEEAFLASLELARPRLGRWRLPVGLARGAWDVAVLAARLRRPSRPFLPSLTGLGQDAKIAARRLRRTPGVTLASVATLALGIGATVAMLTVVDAVLLRPLPYAEPERLVALFLHERAHDARRAPTSPVNFHAWRAETETLELVTAAHPWSPSLTGTDRPDELHGLRVSPALFPLLGVSPLLGRALDAGDAAPTGGRVVVLGYGLFRERFGLDPGIVGRDLVLDGESYRVVGVMPEGYRFPPFWVVDAGFWAPLRFTPEQATRHARYLRVFARLKDGVPLEEARAEMEALGARLEARYPDRNASTGVIVEPLIEPVVSEIRPALLLLLAAVVLLMLTASANVANLQLVRAAGRAREIALETALGAGRARLLRERLTESLLLALAGGVAGGLIALSGVPALVAVAPEDVPRLAELSVDPRWLLVAIGVSLVVALSLGALTAPRGLARHLAPRLGEGSPRTGERRGKRTRDALVVWQLASSVVLLVAASLVVRSFMELRRVDPGFRRERLLTASLLLAGSPHAPPERQVPFLRRVEEVVGALPGVSQVAFVNHLPIGGDSWGLTFALEGRVSRERDRPRASQRTVTPGYFETMRVPLLAGRAFTPGDDEESPRVVVVNATLVSRYASLEEIVGRRIQIGQPSANDWRTVVGVVSDAKQWDLSQSVEPEVYFPYAQNPSASYLTTSLLVASDLPPDTLRAQVESAVWSVAEIPVANVRTMEQILSEHVAPERFAATLFAVFASLALALTVVGLYGVLSYGVSRETAELGIRAALGATRADIARLVLVRGTRLVLVGLGLGLAASLVVGRLVSGLLYGVRAADPLVLGAAAAVLAVTATLAIGLPARRAAALDPVAALRS